MTKLGLRRRAAQAGSRRPSTGPYGMVLVTGPTGSGKTTTLYSALASLNDAGHEHLHRRGPGRVQLRRHQPGADARRHRPELRRGAAQLPPPGPGHHHDRRDPRLRDRGDRRQGRAHRPPGALARCTPTTRRARSAACSNMGIEPFLVTASLNLILAQRLCRKLCHGLQEAGEEHRGAGAASTRACRRTRSARFTAVREGRLPRVQRPRLPRPRRRSTRSCRSGTASRSW